MKAILFVCTLFLISCTDNGGDIDIRDGLATYDTIPAQQLTEDMRVWKRLDSSKVVVIKY